jgi:hypothetical protein
VVDVGTAAVDVVVAAPAVVVVVPLEWAGPGDEEQAARAIPAMTRAGRSLVVPLGANRYMALSMAQTSVQDAGAI